MPTMIERIQSQGLEKVIQEIAFAEPKARGAMVYIPHKAFYDWRDGKGDKDPADMKVTKGYLEAMAGDQARVHQSTFKHPKTGELHHAVEFRNADHAADFVEKLSRAGVKGQIPWHHTGE